MKLKNTFLLAIGVLTIVARPAFADTPTRNGQPSSDAIAGAPATSRAGTDIGQQAGPNGPAYRPNQEQEQPQGTEDTCAQECKPLVKVFHILPSKVFGSLDSTDQEVIGKIVLVKLVVANPDCLDTDSQPAEPVSAPISKKGLRNQFQAGPDGPTYEHGQPGPALARRGN